MARDILPQSAFLLSVHAAAAIRKLTEWIVSTALLEGGPSLTKSQILQELLERLADDGHITLVDAAFRDRLRDVGTDAESAELFIAADAHAG